MANNPTKRSGKSLKERAASAAEKTAAQKEEMAKAKPKKKVTKRKADKRTRSTEPADAASGSKEPKEKKRREKKEFHFSFTGKTRIFIIALVAFIVVIALLYPVGRTYYQSLRQQQRMEAVVQANEERNEEIASLNAELESPEGIEAQAREEYGWVAEGENATVVTNAGSYEDSGLALPPKVDEASIHAPQTWYYKILDAIFFVHV